LKQSDENQPQQYGCLKKQAKVEKAVAETLAIMVIAFTVAILPAVVVIAKTLIGLK